MGEDIELLKRKLDRSIKARKQAEAILEAKALELYNANTQLKKLNDNLEKQVEIKTKAYFDSENKYQQIIESMELGLLEVNTNDRIEKAYSWFCDMTGYDESDLVGNIASDILLPDDQKEIVSNQNETRKRGQAGIYEVQLKKKDGTLIWVLISGAPIKDNVGNIIGSIGIHLDITKRKNLEQDLERAKQIAEHAQQAEKQFLANMSHEIRTPLNAIIGMSHLLYDTQPNSQQVEYLDMIQSSANLLHRLISDILDISKIESGKMEIRKNEFDLVGLIKSLEKTFQLKLDNRPIEINSTIDPAIKNLLIGDDLLLNQILINLLGNADKFTESGTISIDVKQLEKEDNQLLLEFAVCDSGIGIEESKLHLIFKNFEQADLETRGKYGGTGLGLAISKQLVELQSGQIKVSSEVGKGTCFTFTIPFIDSGNAPYTHQIKSTKQSPSALKGIRILIAEDNYMNRKYISGLLKRWDIYFDMANNGQEAVALSKQHQYDIVLMDIQMPIMTGYEATIAIRNNPSPNQFTPIVALTASALIEQKYRSQQLGMNDFLSKPFTPKQLLNVLSNFTKSNGESVTEELEASAFQFNDQLDVDYLNEFYEDDFEHAADMFETFLTSIVGEVPQLQVLFEQENWINLSALAHKLKPTFSMVGLTWLETKALEVETMAKGNQNKASLSNCIDTINSDLEKLLPILKEESQKLSILLN